MRIAYLILTCERYHTTRVDWQRSTVFKNIPAEDLYYLGHKHDPANRFFSWGAPDDYRNLPYKFHDCFKYMDISGYDWYVLIDDDTYVYHDRMVEHLSLYRQDKPIGIGRRLDHIGHTKWGYYLSGGAGTALSADLYHRMCRYIRTHLPGEVVRHWCADICLSLWLRDVGGHMIHCDQFHADVYNIKRDKLNTAITFHHLKDESDFIAHEALV